jgi:hypothetical protein
MLFVKVASDFFYFVWAAFEPFIEKEYDFIENKRF